jgi:hypothetical protein
MKGRPFWPEAGTTRFGAATGELSGRPARSNLMRGHQVKRAHRDTISRHGRAEGCLLQDPAEPAEKSSGSVFSQVSMPLGERMLRVPARVVPCLAAGREDRLRHSFATHRTEGVVVTQHPTNGPRSDHAFVAVVSAFDRPLLLARAVERDSLSTTRTRRAWPLRLQRCVT